MALAAPHVQITCQRLQDRVEALEKRAGVSAGDGGQSHSKPGGGAHRGKPRWLNNRAVASAALLATAIVNGHGPLSQIARIASLLCLLQKD